MRGLDTTSGVGYDAFDVFSVSCGGVDNVCNNNNNSGGE